MTCLLLAGTEGHGVFASHDNGQSWQQIQADLLSNAIHTIHFTSTPTPQIHLLMEVKLLYSADKGATWQAYRATIEPDKMALTMLFHPTSPGTILVGCADGDILQLSSP